jgi:hypothetical protein
MKKLALIMAMVAFTGSAYAGEYVNGYTRSNGTYVQGYTRSTSDNSYNNNYEVKGNTNPYSGNEGTRTPTYNDRTPSYNTQTYGNPGYDYNNSSTPTRSRTRSGL